jgi:hypothetical protein
MARRTHLLEPLPNEDDSYLAVIGALEDVVIDTASDSSSAEEDMEDEVALDTSVWHDAFISYGHCPACFLSRDPVHVAAAGIIEWHLIGPFAHPSSPCLRGRAVRTRR